MKIGILETGLLNQKLENQFDPYPLMFRRLIERANRTLSYQTYSVIRGEMPVSVDDCDGWLVTGSRHGVYEQLDWMLKLEDFIRELHGTRIPLAGICFGHQIIAQALGGKVVKSDQGWGIGLSNYDIVKHCNWMPEELSQVAIYAFHQDQVVQPPQAAMVFLSSEFCPYAGLCYGESIVSIQAHPEFEKDYELALINMYRGNILPAPLAEKALNFMQLAGNRADSQILAEWIATFFMLNAQKQ